MKTFAHKAGPPPCPPAPAPSGLHRAKASLQTKALAGVMTKGTPITLMPSKPKSSSGEGRLVVYAAGVSACGAASHGASADPKGSTKTITRKNAPPIYGYTRGNKKRALAVAMDAGAFEEALKKYKKDWTSAGDTSDYYYKTWCDLHDAYWYSSGRVYCDPLPLSPDKIHIIGALLKEGGYRSGKNFMSAAKVRHVDAGGGWGEALALAARRFYLSTRRGIGPPRQSEPLPHRKIIALNLPEDAITKRGPINPRALHVLATFFLAREMEVATAKRNNMVVDKEVEAMTWRLPVSKTDWEALGV